MPKMIDSSSTDFSVVGYWRSFKSNIAAEGIIKTFLKLQVKATISVH